MSIDNKEIERIKSLQVGKQCNSCKVGYYTFFNKIIKEVRCINCASEPF